MQYFAARHYHSTGKRIKSDSAFDVTRSECSKMTRNEAQWKMYDEDRIITKTRRRTNSGGVFNEASTRAMSGHILPSSGDNGRRTMGGTSWPYRKYVTDTHHALIPTCRHSLKVRSGWRHSSCKVRTITLSWTVSLSCLYRKRWLHRTHQFCRQSDNNFDKLWGYKTFRPRLTKYCRGCVPGIPGSVDVYDPPYYFTSCV